jgi:hypothetical protein
MGSTEGGDVDRPARTTTVANNQTQSKPKKSDRRKPCCLQLQTGFHNCIACRNASMELNGNVEAGKEVAIQGQLHRLPHDPGRRSPGAIGPALIAMQTRYPSKEDVAPDLGPDRQEPGGRHAALRQARHPERQGVRRRRRVHLVALTPGGPVHRTTATDSSPDVATLEPPPETGPNDKDPETTIKTCRPRSGRCLLAAPLIASTPEEDPRPGRPTSRSASRRCRRTDFVNGVYSIDPVGRENWEAIEEFPPYEAAIIDGEEMWNTPFANGKTYADCFPDGPGIAGKYPHWDKEKGMVMTLPLASTTAARPTARSR